MQFSALSKGFAPVLQLFGSCFWRRQRLRTEIWKHPKYLSRGGAEKDEASLDFSLLVRVHAMVFSASSAKPLRPLRPMFPNLSSHDIMHEIDLSPFRNKRKTLSQP